MRDIVNVKQFGAHSDGSASCTASLQRAIDTCAAAGGGTVHFPPGTYITGALLMRSNVTLDLAAGAVIAAHTDVNAFPVSHSVWEGSASPIHSPLIGGEGLKNVALKGDGTIDGRGAFWWDLFNAGKLAYTRPNLIRLVNCRDVLIDGLTITNSPRWTINPVACENVIISSIVVRNPYDSPNTDGINPDSCSNVRICGCQIDVGDDCIAIKSGSIEDMRPDPRPCQNITVTNCMMLHGHGGLVIGSETSGGVRNVTVSNCIFRGTERGVRVKSRRGRGGSVEDLWADNIIMNDVLCPIVVNLFYECGASEDDPMFDPGPAPVTDLTPRIRGLRFRNIAVYGAKYAAAYIRGLPEQPAEDISLDDVSVYMDSNNKLAGAPAMAVGCPDMCRAGFVLESVKNVRLRRVELYHHLGRPVIANGADDLEVTGLLASENNAESPVAIDDILAATEKPAEESVNVTISPDAKNAGTRHPARIARH
jgi:hypothetical protein